jgi:Mce-associated membrane protein
MSRVTSEARGGLRAQDDAPPGAGPVDEPETAGADDATEEVPVEEQPGRRGWLARRRKGRDDDEPEQDVPVEDRSPRDRYDDDRQVDRDDAPRGRRLSLPLVPVLTVLLVLLLGGTVFLWFTRQSPSSVSTRDYVQALEAARSEVVDLTSFDYVTLDQDIARIKSSTTGDLRNEAVNQLDKQRQQLNQAQAVVNTSVVGAGITRANGTDATAVLVIQSTQKTGGNQQAQVSRYRIEAQLKKVGGRWLLSGVAGR